MLVGDSDGLQARSPHMCIQASCPLFCILVKGLRNISGRNVHTLLYDPEIILLDIYPKELETYVNTLSNMALLSQTRKLNLRV